MLEARLDFQGRLTSTYSILLRTPRNLDLSPPPAYQCHLSPRRYHPPAPAPTPTPVPVPVPATGTSSGTSSTPSQVENLLAPHARTPAHTHTHAHTHIPFQTCQVCQLRLFLETSCTYTYKHTKYLYLTCLLPRYYHHTISPSPRAGCLLYKYMRQCSLPLVLRTLEAVFGAGPWTLDAGHCVLNALVTERMQRATSQGHSPS